jgi:hypothetical protein
VLVVVKRYKDRVIDINDVVAVDVGIGIGACANGKMPFFKTTIL